MTGAGVAASRQARIPFEAVDAAGTKPVMFQIESDAVMDVGALMPPLGGDAMRYDPLSARMATAAVAFRLFRRQRATRADAGRGEEVQGCVAAVPGCGAAQNETV